MNDSIIKKLEAEGAMRGGFTKLARRLTRDAAAADDVVQDALMLAIRRASASDGFHPTSISAWIAGTVKYLAIGRKRREHRTAEVEATAARTELSPSTAEIAADIDRRRTLFETLAALDPIYRDVIHLRFFEDMPPRKIAAKLGLSDSAVKSRLARGLDEMRRMLDRSHGGDTTSWVSALAPLTVKGHAFLGFSAGKALLKAKTKTLFAAAVIGVIAIGGFFFWTSRTNDDPSVLSPTSRAVAPAESIAPRRDPATSPTLAPAVVGESPESRKSTESTSAGPEVLVTVRDGTTGDPVADADLWWIDSESVHPRIDTPTNRAVARAMRQHQSISDVMRKFGGRTRTDASGVAKVPATRDGNYYFAAKDDREGFEWNARSVGRSGVVLTIRPIVAAVVRVLDADDRPVGDVPVVAFEGSDRRIIPIGSARTDALGRAELHGAPTGERGCSGFTFALMIPLADTVRDDLIVSSWPNDIVTLRLPPTGKVLVRARWSNGSLVDDGTSVGLRRADAAPGSIDGMPQPYAWTKNGIATFDNIGTNVRLTCYVATALNQSLATVTIDGPTITGESRTIDVTIDRRRVDMSVRFVDESGSPWRHGHVSAAIATDDDTTAASVYLDATRSDIAQWSWYVPNRVDSTMRVNFVGIDAPTGTTVEASAPFTPGPDSPECDLGTVVLADFPHLVAGVVVDHAGVPLGGRSIQILGAPKSRPPGDETSWQPVGWRLAVTADDGTFRINGRPIDHLDLAVRAESTGAESCIPVPFSPGDDNVRCVMRAVAAIRGRLDWGDHPRPPALTVAAWPRSLGRRPARSGPMKGWIEAADDPIKKDTFRFDGIEPGRYDIIVTSGIDREPLAVVEDIVATEGSVVQDPRIDPIDLRGALRIVELDVRDTDGRALFPSGFIITKDDVMQRGEVSPVLMLPRAIDLVSIVLEKDGYFSESLGPIEGRVEVTMVRGIKAPVIAGPRIEFPDAPYRLRVTLEPPVPPSVPGGRRAEGYVALGDRSRGTLERGKTLDLRVRTAGTYTVRWTLVRDDQGYVDELEISAEERQKIAVGADGISEPVELDFDPQLIRKAVQALEEKYGKK